MFSIVVLWHITVFFSLISKRITKKETEDHSISCIVDDAGRSPPQQCIVFSFDSVSAGNTGLRRRGWCQVLVLKNKNVYIIFDAWVQTPNFLVSSSFLHKDYIHTYTVMLQ